MSDILDTDVCREILDRSDLSEDEKLFAVFQQYRCRIEGQQLCVALEMWENNRFSESEKQEIKCKLMRGSSC